MENLNAFDVELDHTHQEFDNTKNHSIADGINRFDFDNFLGVQDLRKKGSKQIWVVGCSFAHGIALKNKNQRYGQLVADYYELPVSFLTMGGSSIDWASDQILRADIRPGDIVIWGITSVNRVSWFDSQHRYLNLGFSYLAGAQTYENRQPSVEEKKFFFKILTDDSRVCYAVRHVLQVMSYCKKLGANLVMISHPELSKKEHASQLTNFLKTSKKYLHLDNVSGSFNVPDKFDEKFIDKIFPFKHRRYSDGSDNKEYYQDHGEDYMHPGPLTHKHWAKQIIEYIDKKHGWIEQR